MPSERQPSTISLDPQNRIRQLCDKTVVSVDDGVPIKRYWRSGKELLRMATVYRNENDLERAFILYMKYITLFVERLPHHVEFKISDPHEKAQVKDNCKMVFPIAEGIKKKLLVRYQAEYDEWLKEKERQEAEEMARLERIRMEEKKRQEENEAKMLADVQSRLNRQIEEAKERQQQIEAAISMSATNERITSGTIFNNNNFTPTPTTSDLKPTPTAPPAATANASAMPQVDRSSKPTSTTTSSSLMSQDDLRPVIVPKGLMEKFLVVAKHNTDLNKETCAILAGKLSQNSFTITHVLVPTQRGTADSCQTENEEELFHVLDEHDLMTLGWIHTHPTQSAFMSSIDLHTHCSYQLMLPEAIAIVCAPKFDQVGIYSLTQHYGLDFVARCRQTGFHPHPKEPKIYEQSAHVVLDDTKKVQLIDLR